MLEIEKYRAKYAIIEVGPTYRLFLSVGTNWPILSDEEARNGQHKLMSY